MTTNSDDSWRNSVYPLSAIVARTSMCDGRVIAFESAPYEKVITRMDKINRSNEYPDHIISAVGLSPDDIVLVLDAMQKGQDIFEVVCDIANSWTPEKQKTYDKK